MVEKLNFRLGLMDEIRKQFAEKKLLTIKELYEIGAVYTNEPKEKSELRHAVRGCISTLNNSTKEIKRIAQGEYQFVDK